MSEKRFISVDPEEQKSPPKAAPPPFDRPTADVILRSSDGVDFKVHKLILSEASSFFETMFSLPQQHDGASHRDDLPVVPIMQCSTVIDNLLRFCYPIAAPRIATLSGLWDLVAAASFYQMDPIAEDLRERALDLSFISQDPFRMYALACGSNWKKGIQAAARAMLGSIYSDISMPYHPAMEDITGADVQRLLSYFRRCGKVARALTQPENMTWVPYYPWFGKKPCLNCTNTELRVYNCHGGIYSYVRTWWMDYMQTAGKELEKRPCRDTILSEGFMSSSWSEEVSRCVCSTKIGVYMDEFKKIFADTVERVLNELEFDLEEAS